MVMVKKIDREVSKKIDGGGQNFMEWCQNFMDGGVEKIDGGGVEKN
jgi:F0F1-type ATP synthase membrane subunit a